MVVGGMHANIDMYIVGISNNYLFLKLPTRENSVSLPVVSSGVATLITNIITHWDTPLPLKQMPWTL